MSRIFILSWRSYSNARICSIRYIKPLKGGKTNHIESFQRPSKHKALPKRDNSFSMPSEEVSLSWWQNPYVYFWGIIIVIIIIPTLEECRLKFPIFDEFCFSIKNAIASLSVFIRKSCTICKNQSPKIEYSSSSMVTIDLESRNHRNFRIYEDAAGSFARPAIFSPRTRPIPKSVNRKKLALVDRRVSSESSSSVEEPIESLRGGPKENNTNSRFSKHMTNFQGITPPIFGKEINSRESSSGYEADTESCLEENLESEVMSSNLDHVKVQEGKLTRIIHSLDRNMDGSNKKHDGAECDTDGPLESKFNSRITSCTFQNDNLPSESHWDSIERYEQNSDSALNDKLEFKFDSCQKNLNGQYKQNKEDNKSWFKQYYDRIFRKSAPLFSPLGRSGSVKYIRKIKEEEATKIEWKSIHSIEMEEDITLGSNNVKRQYLHKDLIPMHVLYFLRDTDLESSDQEDDSNQKLRENTIAEVYEEDSPNVPKIMATTSRVNDVIYNSFDAQPKMQIDDIQPNTMESISCEERRGNEEENNAMVSETRKLKLWKSLPAIPNDVAIFFDSDLADENIRFQNGDDHDIIEKSDDVCEGNEKIFKRARRLAVDPKSILDEKLVRFFSPKMLKRSTFGWNFLGEPNQLIIDVEFDAFEGNIIKDFGVVPNRYKEESAEFWKLHVLSKSCPDLYAMNDDELLKDEKKKSNFIFLQSFEPQQDKRYPYSSNEKLEIVEDSNFDYDDLLVSEEFVKEMGAIISDIFKLSDEKDLRCESKPESLFSANLALKDPTVSLDEQSLIKQLNFSEVSADIDIDEGNEITDSKKILKKSGPGIEKRRLSCDDSIRRNSPDFISNNHEKVSILPNIETTDNASETDEKGIECNAEHSDASNFWDEISLDHPVPVPEPNSSSKIWDKNQEYEENVDQKLDIDPNIKFLLRRSVILESWPKPVRETGRLFRRSSKMKTFKKMEEKCFPEKEDDDGEEELGYEIYKMSPKFLPIPPKTKNSRKQLMVENSNRAIANPEAELPASVEEDDREFTEAGNSSVEDVGESTAEFGILNSYFLKITPSMLGQKIPYSKRQFTLNSFLKRDFE